VRRLKKSPSTQSYTQSKRKKIKIKHYRRRAGNYPEKWDPLHRDYNGEWVREIAKKEELTRGRWWGRNKDQKKEEQ